MCTSLKSKLNTKKHQHKKNKTKIISEQGAHINTQQKINMLQNKNLQRPMEIVISTEIQGQGKKMYNILRE